MLFKNANIVVASDIVLPNASLLVRDGVIEKVGNFETPSNREVQEIDCGERLLLPGLVNLHDHFYGRPAQGISLQDDPPKNFLGILQVLWWKLDRALSTEACFLASKVCSVEAIEAGTTTIFDHHSSPNCVTRSLEEIQRGASECGIRIVPCYELSDRNGSRNAQAAIDENNSEAAGCFGLHAAFTLSDATLKQARELSNKPCFHVHVCEAIEDKGAVVKLNDAGVLNSKTIMAHCVHVDDADIEIIAKSRANVVVNIQSNQNNGVGTPPVEKFLKQGVRVGLGTDGMTQDMLQEFRNFCLLYPNVDAASLLLESNSAIASLILGRKIGLLKEGYEADIILCDYVPLSPLTSKNVSKHLQFGVKKVDCVWVAGALKVSNGKVLNIDKSALFKTFSSVIEHVVWKSPELNRFEDPCDHIFGRDFLRTWDFSVSQLIGVMKMARLVRKRYAEGKDSRILQGLAFSLFRDQSTRTRLAFASAAAVVGLSTFNFDESKSQISHGETVRETSVMTSFLTEVIGIRDDLFLGLGHQYQLDVIEALIESQQKGGCFARTRPTLINLQSDIDHPTQTIADLLHLMDVFGPNLRKKKICISWAYSPSYGKPLSVPGGLIALLPRFGMEVVLAHPKGWELQEEVLELASKGAFEGQGSFTTVSTMEDGVKGCDIVYAKNWGSQAYMKQRTEDHINKRETFQQREKEYVESLKPLSTGAWEYDEPKRATTNDALYMHCLPADISGVNCERGEVSSETFERDRLNTYREASWKPYVIAAMMIMQRKTKAAW